MDERLEQLERLLHVGSALRPDIPPDELYALAGELLADLSGYPTVALWMSEGEPGRFALVSSAGLPAGARASLSPTLSHAALDNLRAAGTSYGEAICLAGAVLSDGAHLPGLAPPAGHAIVLPMLYTDLDGVAAFGTPAPEPDPEGLAFIQQCVDQVTIALTAARILHRHAQTQADLGQVLAIKDRLLAAVDELSTPVLPLLDGVVMLPIVGGVDSGRMRVITEALLEAIARNQSSVALLDITGVPVVDTRVAAALINLARACSLMGCRVVLAGIRPEIAQALVGLGVSMEGISTRASLADGLRTALAMVGLRLAPC